MREAAAISQGLTNFFTPGPDGPRHAASDVMVRLPCAPRHALLAEAGAPSYERDTPAMASSSGMISSQP